jgi:hypothetical protein
VSGGSAAQIPAGWMEKDMTAPTLPGQTPRETLVEDAPQQTQDAMATLVKDAREALTRGTEQYGRQFHELADKAKARLSGNGEGRAEIAEPLTSFFGVPYLWFDLIAVGPFQQVQPLGPFAPARVIRSGERAFLLAAIWRNPFALPFGPNPSAAQVMTGMRYTVRGQTVNVNEVSNGPDLGPVNAEFGAGNVDLHVLEIPTVPAPADGAPRLLDISLTVDVRSGTAGLPPFAGYASRWQQLDSSPPFLFPFIPGVGPVVVPGMTPGLINDTPVRVLIYS